MSRADPVGLILLLAAAFPTFARRLSAMREAGARRRDDRRGCGDKRRQSDQLSPAVLGRVQARDRAGTGRRGEPVLRLPDVGRRLRGEVASCLVAVDRSKSVRAVLAGKTGTLLLNVTGSGAIEVEPGGVVVHGEGTGGDSGRANDHASPEPSGRRLQGLGGRVRRRVPRQLQSHRGRRAAVCRRCLRPGHARRWTQDADRREAARRSGRDEHATPGSTPLSYAAPRSRRARSSRSAPASLTATGRDGGAMRRLLHLLAGTRRVDVGERLRLLQPVLVGDD